MAKRKIRSSEIGMWFSLAAILIGLFANKETISGSGSTGDPILLLVFGGIISIVFFFYRSTKNK